MESALDVLSRAATMVQDNANENRLSSKQLPTTTWRRERRLRTGEYHQTSSGLTGSLCSSSPSSKPPPIAHVQHSPIYSDIVKKTNCNHTSIMLAATASCETTNPPTSPSTPSHSNLAIHFGQIPHAQINSIQTDDAPLDMSVSSLKQRNTAPPPYREPLPGTQFASSLSRPSVITQAPPKKESKDSILASPRENDNRSCESIDEHFRRSLGNDYFSLFSKNCAASQSTAKSSPQPHNPQPPTAHNRSPSPTLPLSSRGPILPQPSDLIPLPEYPVILPPVKSQHAHQNETVMTPKANLSQTTGPNSCPLPLVVRPNLKAKNPVTSTKSSGQTACVKVGSTTQTTLYNAPASETATPIPLQQHSSGVSVSLSHITSTDNTPSSSPRHTPPVLNMFVSNLLPNLPAIMCIKTEPGLQNIKSNNPTPPVSPTSTTNHKSNSVNSSNTISLPSTKLSIWKPANISNPSAEVLASVDDHFAKALGDTWKKLQEEKGIRK